MSTDSGSEGEGVDTGHTHPVCGLVFLPHLDQLVQVLTSLMKFAPFSLSKRLPFWSKHVFCLPSLSFIVFDDLSLMCLLFLFKKRLLILSISLSFSPFVQPLGQWV